MRRATNSCERSTKIADRRWHKSQHGLTYRSIWPAVRPDALRSCNPGAIANGSANGSALSQLGSDLQQRRPADVAPATAAGQHCCGSDPTGNSNGSTLLPAAAYVAPFTPGRRESGPADCSLCPNSSLPPHPLHPSPKVDLGEVTRGAAQEPPGRELSAQEKAARRGSPRRAAPNDRLRARPPGLAR